MASDTTTLYGFGNVTIHHADGRTTEHSDMVAAMQSLDKTPATRLEEALEDPALRATVATLYGLPQAASVGEIVAKVITLGDLEKLLARIAEIPTSPFFVIALGGGRYLKAIDEQRGLSPADRVISTDELAEAMPFDSYFSANDFCTREVLEAYLYANPLRIGAGE